MNFIYTIILFAIISTTGFSIASFLPAGNLWNTAIIAGVIFLIAAVIALLAMVFHTMEFKNDCRRYFNEIRENLRDLKSIKKEMNSYKEEITDSLTKLYPEYEKDMFKNMNPSDAENISALMVKYPELKFNGVLERYTNKLSEYITLCNKKERENNELLRKLENVETNGWMLASVDRPEFVNKLFNAEFE